MNITARQFSSDIWNQMVIEAANSRSQGVENHKNICRVIYPKDVCNLELKNDQEIKDHFTTYGSWDSNCGKMPFSEVINITRMFSLNTPVTPELKNPLSQSLLVMASRAEKKYNNGFKGVVRKVISIFFNFFATNSVSLFSTTKTDFSFRINQINNKSKLPLFIGNDANFARLVEKGL